MSLQSLLMSRVLPSKIIDALTTAELSSDTAERRPAVDVCGFFQPQRWTHNRVSFPFCEVGNFIRKLSRFTVECVAPPHARKLSLLVGLLINITNDDNAIFPSLFFHYLALIERKVKLCVFC